MPTWWVLLLAFGATARITRFLVADVLAAPIRAWWTSAVGEDSLAAELSRCAWCVSVWVAAPVLAAAILGGTHLWFTAPAAWLSLSYAVGLAAANLDR